ncbi:MAG: hypothetical protein ABI977_13380 [Acidobacteriota bacterium]
MGTDASTVTSLPYSLAPMLSVPQWRSGGGVLQVGIRPIEVYRMEDPGGLVVARPPIGSRS